ncbi:putative ribonuclease H protein [Sesbania bispinosa]|nr:putative ribonuclease H protein [Sesbania bispinosa]
MNSYVTGGAPVGKEDMEVAELLDADTGQWRFHLLRNILPAKDVENIIQINIPSAGGEDQLIWKLSRDGSLGNGDIFGGCKFQTGSGCLCGEQCVDVYRCAPTYRRRELDAQLFVPGVNHVWKMNGTSSLAVHTA